MKKTLSVFLALLMLAGLFTGGFSARASAEEADSDPAAIEAALDLSAIAPEWTYSDSADAWVMEVVTAVTNAELPDYQGVSVCVPGAYVLGIDTDGDGEPDVTEGSASGVLVIDYDASMTSTNGQVYTAATAPVIINTGAAGYSAQVNQSAGTTYAAEGYVNVACGNRGKQSTLTDSDGATVYTGDAPSCLVDQKNAVRFVKYNILLGNLPGSVDYFVSTGGSGGGAHATMLAATSNHPDFYPYEAAAGAVGVYDNGDGTYTTAVTIDGQDVALSDGLWGCMAYSAITSLAEADMTLAFEYFLDADYGFNTGFQKQLAEYLAAAYRDTLNARNWSVDEADVGFDLDGDGELGSTVPLTIEYDPDAYPETRGYYGSYLDLYLHEFEQSLQAYLDRLAYADDWTWFDADGAALSDDEVASMTDADRAEAFLNGWYASGSDGSSRGAGGGPGGAGGPGGRTGGFGGGSFGGFGGSFDGEAPDMTDGFPGQDGEAGGPPDLADGAISQGADASGAVMPEGEPSEDGATEEVGTPDAGTTQSASSKTDSSNYADYDEMLAAYEADVAEVQAGDAFGNNIVELYNPLNYIGDEDTSGPVWARILCGASEGDISMLNSLNLQIAWLNAGTDAEIEWQWNGGHVPSEIFGDSLALYVDSMVGKYVDGAVEVTKAAAEGQTANGTAEEASGTDLSDWVTIGDDGALTMTLSGAAAYRTAGASKATPGFDVIDYGQEDYVFGSAEKDARHWDGVLLELLTEHADTLSALFNQ